MAVTYSSDIATIYFSTFLKLLCRWKGSVYKLIWFDCIVYLFIYGIISVVYRHALNDKERTGFEAICLNSQKLGNLIPVAFILGFYVTMVVNRWWSQFLTLPWPDAIALNLTAYVDGKNDRALIIRRTVIRYVNLSLALCLRSISSKGKKLFPKLESLVTSGLITEEEFELFKNVDSRFNRFYVPLIWAVNIVSRARMENLIRIDPEQNILIEEIDNFRQRLNTLFIYDWVNPPLVYTQVTTLSVYGYFILSLFARQFLDPSKNYKNHDIDLYFPMFTMLQFVFYIGWLKVAEELLNPFGDDDNDFDVGFLLERNLEFSYVLVDDMHNEHPKFVKDAYWDSISPRLPYTVDTKPGLGNGSIFAGSLLNLEMRMSGLIDLSETLPAKKSTAAAENEIEITLTPNTRSTPRFSVSSVT